MLIDEFELGDLEFWRRMPFKTFIAWQRLAMIRSVNRKARQQGG